MRRNTRAIFLPFGNRQTRFPIHKEELVCESLFNRLSEFSYQNSCKGKFSGKTKLILKAP